LLIYWEPKGSSSLSYYDAMMQRAAQRLRIDAARIRLEARMKQVKAAA
jgi:hypothetical protein